MDEIQKEQIVCAIYVAIYNSNYKCAYTILDDIVQLMVNKTLDKVIEIIDHNEQCLISDKIRELKED